MNEFKCTELAERNNLPKQLIKSKAFRRGEVQREAQLKPVGMRENNRATAYTANRGASKFCDSALRLFLGIPV